MGPFSSEHKPTQAILDTFEQCVAGEGYEAASLEEIARRLDMEPHNIEAVLGKNRDPIEQLAEHVIRRSSDRLYDALHCLPDDSTNGELLDLLFRSNASEVAHDVLAIENLIDAGQNDSVIGRTLSHWLETVVHALADCLRARHPHAAPSKCHDAAWGIISIVFQWDSFIPSGLSDEYRESSRRCCEQLLSQLDHLDNGWVGQQN